MYKTGLFVNLQFIFIIVILWVRTTHTYSYTNSILGPSDHREAYFNGTSYIRLLTTISLQRQQVALSFRTCIGGELFTQQYKEQGFAVTVTKTGLNFQATINPLKHYTVSITANLLDNKWHTVQLEYRLGNLTMSVAGQTQLIANSTYNTELLTNPNLSNEGAILLVGKQFSGCILEGPSLVFNTSYMHPHNVFFGPCPLPTNSCIPETDFLQLHNIKEEVDHCLHEPCMRHGICVSRPDRYECHCRPRYAGNNCEQDIGSPCKREPPICENGAVCIEDKYGDVQCVCASGFTGKHCELEISIQCDSDPCLNNGTCRLAPATGQPECICADRFTGVYCDIDENESCQSMNPCLNGGTCVNEPSHRHQNSNNNNYTCHCFNTGYEGTHCERNVNECAFNPCLNHGVCFDTFGSYVCQCPVGFDGHNCELNLNECISTPCQNKGSCIDKIGGYECLCSNGYTGTQCELSVCGDMMTCPSSYAECRQVEQKSRFRCVCKQGWSGIYPNCTQNADEGICLNTTPCVNGGTCVPYSLDSFNCTCPPGFSGKYCQLNIDECVSQPCLNGGTCIDQTNGFYCNCTEDFMGATCDRPYDICELKPCKNNATCTTAATKRADFTCNCLPGFNGITCENNIDECAHVKCSDGRICVDLVAGYECRCPDGYTGDNCTYPIDPCAKSFCHNGGTCKLLTHGTFTCSCPKGFTGRYCEQDIDECASPICMHGICINKHGGFQCYCMPGYTGETCSLDFDECLSQPCRNNATCLNKVNNYECICTPGYTGKDCSVDINECESSPCYEGSTCIDDIAAFKCVCQPGVTGRLCHINIDDCQSSPCLHNGICVDGLNNYTCNCSSTGYTGFHCEINVDDCLSNPCANGAHCVDGVNDYLCNCYPGYTGKNCQLDINECESSPCQYSGTCFQRSTQSLYNNNSGMPFIYMQPFSYENASGYECVCIPGISGKDCEIDINECESSPCQKGGTCRDKIGGYYCECEEGVEGEHCEIDINECERYTPCIHGTCVDLKADYFCDCLPYYGGKNCSVELIGCVQNPCLNNGTCKPYLENETLHKFNCSCPNGFHGDACEKITTMSLSGQSYIAVNTSRDEGYDIQFRFKTTLGDGLLAIGKGLTYYILELVHGRLNLHSSLLNKWEGVFIGSALNDSNWQKVFVAINSSHLVLAANEEQTIYPINLNEGSNATHTSFPTTYLGGTISELRRLTHGPPAFVGCTEDVIINGEWVLPPHNNNNTTAWMSLVSVQVGCSRTPQCNPNPCHSGGRCTDKWRTFSCTCERPYLGHTCQYNYTAATFGYENVTNSLVTVSVTDTARRAVRSIVDISMFIRTRQSVGQIFYIGSTLSTINYNDDNHISAKLDSGELLVSILFNGTPESYTVSGVKLDNGYDHLIQVIRNVTLVQVKLNGTEYFRKTISGSGQLDAQVLYLGGIPQVKRPVRQTDTSSTAAAYSTTNTITSVHFKGIIQDVQISNGSHRMVVEFFPLEAEEEIPPFYPFGTVSFDRTTLMEGVISDDLCRNNPCDRNGTCTNTWNDFKCHCPRGFKGKTCSDLEFCQLKQCPAGSQCRNLEDGYECIANATFDGKAKEPLMYTLEHYYARPVAAFETLEINYRTKIGGTILYASGGGGGDYMFVHVNQKNQITVQWSFAGSGQSHRFEKDNRNGDWNTLYFAVKEHLFYGGFKELVFDDTPNVIVNDFNGTLFDELFMKGTLYLGATEQQQQSYEFMSLHDHYQKYNNTTYYIVNESSSSSSSRIRDDVTNTIELPFQTTTTAAAAEPIIQNNIRDVFKGCLGEIRIGDVLVPYFLTTEIYTLNSSTHYTTEPYYSLHAGQNEQQQYSIGCRVCFDSDCLNDGMCLNAEQNYECNCAAGYTAQDCSINIDECEENRCQNNATCFDGIANFTCACLAGYNGWLCDTEINECESNPCRNGGTCVDQLADYECVCTEDYVGRQCEALRLITCDNQPCQNGSTCTDGTNLKTGNNFTCACAKGMTGALCDTAFCVATPCQHGSCNQSNGGAEPPYCWCDRGYEGLYCQIDTDDCVLPTTGNTPCLHAGQCIDDVDKYICNCTGTGFVGLLCELDIDECQMEYSICGPRGICKNTAGSYQCECPEGMCGTYCALIDPCLHNPCGEHGLCNSTCTTQASFHCDCLSGYYGPHCNNTVTISAGSNDNSSSSSSNTLNIVVIVIPIVVILLLGGVAGLVILIAMARSKRATRGTYSPSAQEFCNPRVELDHVLKPPPEERLI